MKALKEFLTEAKKEYPRLPKSAHERGLGQAIGDEIASFHVRMAKDEIKDQKEKFTPKHHLQALKNALEDHREYDRGGAHHDSQVHHEDSFQRVMKHTETHLKNKITEHKNKHGLRKTP